MVNTLKQITKIINKADISEKSKNLYISRLDSIRKKLEYPDNTNINKNNIYLDIDAVINLFDKLNTRNAHITAVVSFLKIRKKRVEKDILKKYQELLHSGLVENTEFRLDNRKNKKQDENWIEWEQLQKQSIKKSMDTITNFTGKRLKNKEQAKNYLYQDLILLILYLRSDYLIRLDYFNTKIISDESENDKEENFILIRKGKPIILFLNHYKNIRYHGKLRLILFDEMDKMYKFFLKWKDIIMNDETNEENYLFFNFRVNKPYTSKRFSEYFIKVFNTYSGKKINLNMLRSIKSSWIEGHKNLTLIEKRELHKKLLHSAEEGRLYSKIDEIKEE